jgi:uncharacterized membrane-anchored protein YitT (DUF2179 family)
LKKQFHEIVVQQIKKALGKPESPDLSAYELAKGFWRLRVSIKNALQNAFLISLGIFSAGFGLKGFLIPNNFIDGGAMGISLLINQKTEIPLSLLILLVNLPFLLMGWQHIGKAFSIKSIIAISLLSIVVAFVPYPTITNDKLLIAIFGGFFLGTGIGLSIRGGAVIDGTEIMAIFLSRKRSSLSVGDYILVFNLIIFTVAAYLLTIEIALYSILIYLAASKTVDFILEGIEEFTGVTIISPHNTEIADMIKNKMGRGLTIYSGKRGYGKSGDTQHQTEIIFTVTTRLEISKLTHEIDKIDPYAFIVTQSLKDTKGGMVKKRPAHNA